MYTPTTLRPIEKLSPFQLFKWEGRGPRLLASARNGGWADIVALQEYDVHDVETFCSLPGSVHCLPCDKDRIRPFCKKMWQRKANHFSAGSAMVRQLYAWRYLSHMQISMVTTAVFDPS